MIVCSCLCMNFWRVSGFRKRSRPTYCCCEMSTWKMASDKLKCRSGVSCNIALLIFRFTCSSSNFRWLKFFWLIIKIRNESDTEILLKNKIFSVSIRIKFSLAYKNINFECLVCYDYFEGNVMFHLDLNFMILEIRMFWNKLLLFET